MKYTIFIIALVAVFFAAAAASFADRDATAAETASVAEALGGEGCVLSEVVEVDGKGIFEVDGIVCEDGNYDVKLDAEYNIVSRTKVPPAEGTD